MFSKLSIKNKLIMANGLVIFLFSVSLWLALEGMFSSKNASEAFFSENLVRQQAYQNMFANGLLSGVALRNMVMNPALKKGYTVVPASIKRFDDAFAVAKAAPIGDASVQESYDSIQKHWQKSRQAKLQILELLKAGDIEGAKNLLVKEEHPNWQKVRIEVQKLTNAEQQNNKTIQQEFLSNSNATLFKSLITAVIAIVISLLIGFLITRSIRNAFGSVIESLNDIASGEGDLTRRLDEKGEREVSELAAAFNRFVNKIQDMVRQVGTSTDYLITSLQHLTQLSVDTKLNVNQQETQIDQVATAMNEMTSTVQEVAHNASEASNSAQSADKEAGNGQDVVSEVIQAINELANEVGHTSATINTLNKDTEEIGGVLDVIKGIAEQTNLLALNAAIEAARAGEQGRGFAVVADEVRTLASKTQESTQVIQGMIERLQSGAKDAVQAMEKGQQKTTATVDKAELAGQALSAITQAVSNIAMQNTQIATAAEEQSAVAEDINKNVVGISNLAIQSAQDAENAAASSQELERIASDLQKMVSVFKV